MGEVFLSVDDGELTDLQSLLEWLRQEPELRGQLTTRARPPNVGEMGPVTDVVVVAAGSGGALTVLATSLRTWLAQPRRSDVRIKVRSANGRTVEVDAKRISDVEALVRAALGPNDEENPGASA
jgi:hypothetical protein